MKALPFFIKKEELDRLFFLCIHSFFLSSYSIHPNAKGAETYAACVQA